MLTVILACGAATVHTPGCKGILPIKNRVKTKGSLLEQVETSEEQLTKPGSLGK